MTWAKSGQVVIREDVSTLKATTRVKSDTGRWKVRRPETAEIDLLMSWFSGDHSLIKPTDTLAVPAGFEPLRYFFLAVFLAGFLAAGFLAAFFLAGMTNSFGMCFGFMRHSTFLLGGLLGRFFCGRLLRCWFLLSWHDQLLWNVFRVYEVLNYCRVHP